MKLEVVKAEKDSGCDDRGPHTDGPGGQNACLSRSRGPGSGLLSTFCR
jgi:hypothetical protein